MDTSNEVPRGAWMQVQPRRRPRKQEKNSDHRGNETRNGSRFSILDPDENNLDDVVHQHADNNHTARATNGKGPANVTLGKPQTSITLENNITKKWTPKQKKQGFASRKSLGDISNVIKSSIVASPSDKAASCSKRPIMNNPANIFEQPPSFSFGDQAVIAFVSGTTETNEVCMRSNDLFETHHADDKLISGHKPPNIERDTDQQKGITSNNSTDPFICSGLVEDMIEDHELTDMEIIVPAPTHDRSSNMEASTSA